MSPKLKLIVLSILLFFAVPAFSQEICDNGIDDDGDGLVDLNDDDCACSGFGATQEIPSLIPNPGFEDMNCCPSTFSQLSCAQTWIQATTATSDYFNCGYNFGAATNLGITAHSGTGYVGAIYQDTWREYVGACLLSPMLANENYKLSFAIASFPMDGWGGVCNGLNYGPIDVCIFGAPNCSDLPVGTTNCPTAANPNWQIIGSATYNPQGSWEMIEIDLNPTININAIMIGPPCGNLPPGYQGSPCYAYFVYDDLILAQNSFFNSVYIDEYGSFCQNSLYLEATTDSSGGSWQWYQNGVALVGETSDVLDISGNGLTNGVYQVRYTIGNKCDIAEYTITLPELPVADFNFDLVCEGSTTNFTDQSTSNSSTIAGWSWDFDNDQVYDATGSSASYTFPASGNFPVTLLVTDSDGCKDSIVKNVTVHPNPEVDMLISEVCAGSSSSFADQSTVDNSQTNNIDQWSWDFGDGNAETSQNPVHIYNNEGIYDVTLVVSTNHGCVASGTSQAIVYPNPIVNFTSSIVCNGNTTSFTDQSTVNNSITTNTITSWYWDFKDGTSSTQQNPTHVFTSEGDYYVILTVTTDHNCSATDSVLVTVLPNPTADFDFTTVCLGTPTDFQDQSTSPVNTIVGWDWDFDNDLIYDASGSSASYTFGNDGYVSVLLKITDDQGCIDSIVKNVPINPNPEIDFSATGVCEGGETQFTDLTTISNSVPSNTLDQWSWDFDDGNTSTTQNPTNNYTSEGVYTVELTVTSNNGCVASGTGDVYVYPNPVVNFTPTAVCLGGTNQFTDASTVSNIYTSNDIVDWYWDFMNGTTSTQQNPEAEFSSAGIYDVSLTVTTDHGCTATDVVQVTVFPNPTADFEVEPVCQNTNSVFTDLSQIDNTNGDFIVTWNWDFGDGNSSQSQNPTHNYSSENVYDITLTVTSNNGCSHSVTYSTDVYPNPEPNFSAPEVCHEEITFFTDQSSISNAHTSNQIVDWQWDFNDGLISNEQSPEHTYALSGTYNVTLTITSNHDCVTSITIPVTVNPNPSADFQGIDLEGCSVLCPVITSINNNPADIQQYLWTLSDGTTYSGTSPILSDCFYLDGGDDLYLDVHLLVTTHKGCTNSSEEINYIKVYHNPIADFEYDPKYPDLLNRVIDFTNTSLYADSYFWTFDDFEHSNMIHPVIEFPENAGDYVVQLVAITDHGCTDTIVKIIPVIDEVIFYVPNTFTPDNDDFNEVFKPIFSSGYDPQTYTLYIFNRWGEIMFESHDVNKGWDGTYGTESGHIVKDGTYIWKIEFKTTLNDEHKVFMGHVNLLK